MVVGYGDDAVDELVLPAGVGRKRYFEEDSPNFNVSQAQLIFGA